MIGGTDVGLPRVRAVRSSDDRMSPLRCKIPGDRRGPTAPKKEIGPDFLPGRMPPNREYCRGRIVLL